MIESKTNSVLIVDDVNANIIALTDILKSEYTIYAAKSGQRAIQLAEEFLPDVILLDILMPEMDGYEVIKALKNSDKTLNIPVIFITGLDKDSNEEKALELGAADYISKPFSSSVVKLRVRYQVEMINQMRKNIEKERAEKNSRAQIDFLMRMSHEMLTPLNAVMGLTQVLKMQILNMRNVSAEMNMYFDEIDNASRYLLKLIHDLLDVSGKSDGAFKLNDAAFSFRELFQNVIKECSHDAAKKQQALTFDIDPSIPAWCYGDRERLTQVLTNLLTNAVKFTPEYGAVHVSAGATHKGDGTVILRTEVIDNGIGISKERQNKIFSLFEQGEGSTTRERGGIGLGLPISKRIAEMMGGEILVESEPDKGAKFTFICKMRI